MTGVSVAAGVAVIAVICGALIRRGSRETGLLFSLGAAAVLFLFAVSESGELIDTARALTEESGMGEILTALLKALGIVLIGRIAVGFCKDAGESALASGVEFASKTAVLLVSLPLLERVLDAVREVLAT